MASIFNFNIDRIISELSTQSSKIYFDTINDHSSKISITPNTVCELKLRGIKIKGDVLFNIKVFRCIDDEFSVSKMNIIDLSGISKFELLKQLENLSFYDRMDSNMTIIPTKYVIEISNDQRESNFINYENLSLINYSNNSAPINVEFN